MIQRIQSIYLLAAALTVLLMHFFPSANFGSFAMYACHIKSPENGNEIISMVALAFLPLISALISLFTIFKFKNRKLQLKLGWLNILLLITIIAVEQVYMVEIGERVHIKAAPGFISIMPFIALLFVLLSNRAIKKDDNLVKSADRIR